MKIARALKKSPPALLFAALLAAAVLAQTAVLEGSTRDSVPGAIGVPFPVYLDNDEVVAGVQAVINYSTTYLIFNEIQPSERMANFTFVVNSQPPVLYIAALANSQDDLIDPGNGTIFSIIFDVDESASYGAYDVLLQDSALGNISAQLIYTESSDGLFNIVMPYNITFLPPITNQDLFPLQNGTTLPLKFNVTDGTYFVHDDSVIVEISNTTLGFSKEYNASGTGNDYIAIEDGDKYIVLVHTKDLGMEIGLYNIDISFDNFQTEETMFELVNETTGRGKKKGQ